MPDPLPDIFISYTHSDNDPPGDDMKGWVELFHYSLSKLVNQLEKNISIWRDSKTHGNDIVERDVREKIIATKLLVAILSPPYLKSRWCLREIRWFVKSNKLQKALTTDIKSPIFKVAKTRTDRNRQPRVMRGMTGYNFFHYEETTEYIKHFRQGKGVPYDPEYWENLDKLAQDIVKTLKLFRPKAVAPAPSAAPETAVYLAVPTPDLQSQHKRIKDELHTHQYRVLPDDDSAHYEPLRFPHAVADYLDRSAASIHLVGKTYFDLPDNVRAQSLVRLQNQFAADRLLRPHFSRLIWVPPEVKITDSQQLELVGHDGRQWLQGTQFLQSSLDELKSVMLESLKPKQHHKPAANHSSVKTIYLVFDQQDFERIAPVYSCLFDQGYEVITPSFDDKTKSIEFHKAKLAGCDAVLIYYGRGDQNWIESHLSYLEAARSFQSPDQNHSDAERPWLAKLIYVSPPHTGHKQIFNTRKATVLKPDEDFKCEHLKDFFELIQRPLPKDK